jgi:hypothetical protein
MKRFLLIPWLALCAVQAHAQAPPFVRSAVNAVNTSGTAVSIAGETTTAGDTAVVLCGGNSTTGTLSVADGGTDTFAPSSDGLSTSANEGDKVEAFIVTSLAGGTKTITCTSSNSVAFMNIWYYETGPAVADVAGHLSSDSAGNSATPTLTLSTAANAVLISAVDCGNTCSAGTCTPSACANSLSDTFGDEAETQSNTSSGSTSDKFSQTSGTYHAWGMSIKSSGGGAATPRFDKRRKLDKLDEARARFATSGAAE